jgi:hypothetical protein
MELQQVLQSGVVCENCYSIIREQATTKDLSRGFQRTDTNLVARPDTTERAACDSPEPRACAECGDIDGYERRPASKQTLLRYAANLSQTLDEFGVEHDHLTLLAVATELKSQPDNAGNDRQILAEALHEATTRRF